MILKDDFGEKRLNNVPMNILVGCNDTKVRTII